MRRSRTLPALTAAALAVGLALVAPPAVAGGLAGRPDRHAGYTAPFRGTYTNPISAGMVDTFADPAIIRGKDGYWYAYGTTDPLLEGEGTRHLLPISRSTDLVTWEHVGDAFTETTLPSWADTSRGAALWAPDIRYVDGEYRLYYVVTETTVTDEPNDNAIGVATAPHPTGPWTDAGEPVVGPRRGGAGEPGNFLWTFDPSHVTDTDGTQHLFYGSYYGGIFVTELSDDGTTAVGDPVQVAIDNKYEGAYVIHRDGRWWLFASAANCCAGPTTGYSVHVGVADDVTGPYVDREGVPLLQSRAGGTPVLYQNGNTWVGTGHNGLVTDLSGQDWVVYHAIDPADPYLDGTDGINERPMLLDRLDWVDGWPSVNAGAGPSDTRMRAPATDGRVVTDFSDGLERVLRTQGRWTTATDADSGAHLRSRGAGAVLTRATVVHDVRVEADVRTDGDSRPGLVVGYRGNGEQVRAVVRDGSAGPELAVEVVTRRGRGTRVAASDAVSLPAGVDLTTWKALVLHVQAGVATAELSHARLGDPLAVVEVTLPRKVRPAGRAGALASGPGVDVDNLSVLAPARPVRHVVQPPRPGGFVDGDEFDGPGLDEGWTALRDPDVEVASGELRWVVEPTDLVGGDNAAGVLLRDAPEGDWIAETKVTIDLGTGTVRNFQQAGIVAYAGDDHFARLSHVAIWNTRQTEFGYEMPFAGRLQYGGSIVGPPDDTTWLRLTRTEARDGTQRVQASTSRDGLTWVHGATWTFGADEDVRIGLVAHGNQGGDPATARFDHVRVWRTKSR